MDEAEGFLTKYCKAGASVGVVKYRCVANCTHHHCEEDISLTGALAALPVPPVFNHS